jgi:hypothetical protein
MILELILINHNMWTKLFQLWISVYNFIHINTIIFLSKKKV